MWRDSWNLDPQVKWANKSERSLISYELNAMIILPKILQMTLCRFRTLRVRCSIYTLVDHSMHSYLRVYYSEYSSLLRITSRAQRSSCWRSKSGNSPIGHAKQKINGLYCMYICHNLYNYRISSVFASSVTRVRLYGVLQKRSDYP